MLGTRGVLHCRPEQFLLAELSPDTANGDVLPHALVCSAVCLDCTSPAFQCCTKCISDDIFLISGQLFMNCITSFHKKLCSLAFPIAQYLTHSFLPGFHFTIV